MFTFNLSFFRIFVVVEKLKIVKENVFIHDTFRSCPQKRHRNTNKFYEYFTAPKDKYIILI